MRPRSFHIFALSLSIGSVHASLPYSIPDLGYEGLFQRDTIRATAASSSLLSSTNILSGSDSSTPRHTTLHLAPFPTGINSTSTLSATGGSTRDTSNTSSSLPRTTETSAVNTPLDSAIASKASLSPSLSGSSNNTILTSTSSTARPTDNFVVTVTLTPSNGAPIFITKTVTPTPPLDGGLASMSSSQTRSSSQVPAPGGGPRAKFPSASVFDVVVDGLTYPLPNPDQPPIEIFLLDGSIAQLFAGKVTLRGQTLNIPNDLSTAQPITTGGQSITAQPGTSKQPDRDDKDDGGGGPFAFLAGIAGVAGGAAMALGGAATSAATFSSGAAGVGGVAAGSLATTFSGAVGGANSVVSALNGIQQAFPAGELSKAGMDTFSNAQNLGRGSMAWMQSIGNVLQGFDNLSPDQQQNVRDNVRDYAKPNGPLAQAAKALKAVSEFPWEEKLPKTRLPSATAKPEPTQSAQVTSTAVTQSPEPTTSKVTNPTSTITSSSSSASPSTTEQPLPYYFASRWGTPADKFKDFVQELDGGVGKLEITEYDQAYRTNLTSDNVDALQAKYPFLILASADISDPDDIDFEKEQYHAIPRSRTVLETHHGPEAIPETPSLEKKASLGSSLRPRRLLREERDAPYWKKMISSPFQDPLLRGPSQDPPYIRDESQGRGTTIYVLDDGFDLSYEDLAPAAQVGRRVDTFFVSNDDAFASNFVSEQRNNNPTGNTPHAHLIDARLGGGTGHGTKMAIIAAGKVNGIAPNADLYLLKIKGEWNQGPHPDNKSPRPNYNSMIRGMGMRSVLNTIRRHVESRLAIDSSARSVINLSGGVIYDPENTEVPVTRHKRGKEVNDLFVEFIAWCKDKKVTFIVAAGNKDVPKLHQATPQRLGTSDNGLITVGGVNEDGTLYHLTTVQKPGKAGSMTVFAPAQDVRVPGPGPEFHAGTSQAAAIVSGMAAYYYGLVLPNSQVIVDMKLFMKQHAWTRVRDDKLGEEKHLDVVYNLGRGDVKHVDDPCFVVSRKRDGALMSACSRLQSSSTLTSSTISAASSATATSLIVSSVPSSQLPTTTSLSSSAPPLSSQQPNSSISTSLISSPVLSSQVSTSTASPSSSNPSASSQQSSATISSSSSSTPASSQRPTPPFSTVSPPTPASSQQPTPITSSSNSPPAPIATPKSDTCRIYVNEYDDVDPNNHEEQVWNASIYPDTGSTLKDNSYMCMTGVDGGDAGVDVPCEPIGETFHLGRDADNVLRFIRGKETWTSADAKCRIVKDWWLPHDNQKEIRKRETECKFECKIDWAKPPTINVF